MGIFEQLITIFRIPDLRRKVLITVALLGLCRVGVYVPLPGIDTEALGKLFENVRELPGGNVLGLLNLFAGGALSQGAIFGLGIMPYISASIIFQLLASVIPQFERLRKEGEAGYRKLNQYTRMATVLICLFQGAVVVRGLMALGVGGQAVGSSGGAMALFTLTNGFLLMVGTMLLMWIGEQIDTHGIGNGISLIIMINILSRLPSNILQLSWQITAHEDQQSAVLKTIALAGLFIAVIVAIVFITQGERRIPVQQARHVRGPKVYGGQKHYLPLRVNQAGVMPIIFAQALLMFPMLIATTAASALKDTPNSLWYRFFNFIGDSVGGQQLTLTYIVLYGTLIFFFSYFWTAVMHNPKEMSENLKDYGSFIPGIRPGQRTADYLEGVMNRVTMAGSFFLIVIALMPMLVAASLGIGAGIAGFYGGTSILIVVGVALDLARRINDHLQMHRYSGFAAGAGGRRRTRRHR